MNTSQSKALNLSRQAQAVVLFLCLTSIALTHPISAQTHPALLASSQDRSTHFTNPNFAISDRPPPYSTGRVIGQIALGTAAGVASGLVGGFMGFAISTSSCDHDFACGIGGVLIGSTLGLVGGSAIGVMAAGYTRTTEIRYGHALAGSAAGFLAGAVLLGMLDEGGDNTFLVLVSPAIGATLLGNTSRRYRAGRGPQGLLNWDDGQFHLGVPMLQRQPLGGMPQTFVRSVRLLEVRW